MKIRVSVNEKGHTSVKVDGTELNMLVTGFYSIAGSRGNPRTHSQSSNHRRSRH